MVVFWHKHIIWYSEYFDAPRLNLPLIEICRWVSQSQHQHFCLRFNFALLFLVSLSSFPACFCVVLLVIVPSFWYCRQHCFLAEVFIVFVATIIVVVVEDYCLLQCLWKLAKEYLPFAFLSRSNFSYLVPYTPSPLALSYAITSSSGNLFNAYSFLFS